MSTVFLTCILIVIILIALIIVVVKRNEIFKPRDLLTSNLIVFLITILCCIFTYLLMSLLLSPEFIFYIA